ncbi:MAG: molecular chaperone DnaK, partial [Bdellovibrionales bacterium]|nr:molecular chaperone DnaK [Bdellovibrionales bacterium]
IKDGGDKISDDAKKEVEAAIEEAKKHLESESIDELKAALERLQNVSHKVAGEMYQQGAQPGPEAQQQQQEGDAKSEKKKDDDDVVDADFKEV